jgi:putative aminopeptidase FrvX
VTNLGGVFPWKWGEGPVTVMAQKESITGILSIGSVHTNARESAAARAREDAVTWESVRIFTGLSSSRLTDLGVRPGTRVALHPSRRALTEFGQFVAGPFLDDRADLAAWLLTLEGLAKPSENETPKRSVVFAATAAEEVGGHGALYLLNRLRPEVAIALEIGPCVPESSFAIDSTPTVWVNDSYSAMQARDIDLVARAAKSSGFEPHWQALSRGGSDATCAAAHGLVARPITLAFAAENSHGYEIMHRDSVQSLADFTLSVINCLVYDQIVTAS